MRYLLGVIIMSYETDTICRKLKTAHERERVNASETRERVGAFPKRR